MIRWLSGVPGVGGPEWRSDMLIDFIVERDLSEGARFRRWSGGENIPPITDWSGVAVIFGAYLGDSTSRVLERGADQVHSFEPVPSFAASLRDRFVHDDRVVVHESAVTGQTSQVSMTISSDATSVSEEGGVSVSAKSGSEALRAIDSIFYLEINIEGSEYEVLNDLISSGSIGRIRNLWVQFHDFDEEAELSRAEIRHKLRRTHTCQVSFAFVWEWWVLTASA